MVTTNLLASSDRGRPVLGPRPGRDRRAGQPRVARRLDDRARRSGSRRPHPAEPDGRRVRHRAPSTCSTDSEHRGRPRGLLHRQVDQDHVPGHGRSWPRPAPSTSSRRRSTWPRRSRTCRPAAAATFSLALRPDVDTRQVDASVLGTTTNEVIIRYGLPIPVLYPPAEGRCRPPAPTPIATAARHRRSTPSASPAVSPSPATRSGAPVGGSPAAGRMAAAPLHRRIHLRAADPARLPAARSAVRWAGRPFHARTGHRGRVAQGRRKRGVRRRPNRRPG